jgi:hypothetical protein
MQIEVEEEEARMLNRHSCITEKRLEPSRIKSINEFHREGIASSFYDAALFHIPSPTNILLITVHLI